MPSPGRVHAAATPALTSASVVVSRTAAARRREAPVTEKDAAHRLAEASRLATQELHKQGTPDYDPRAHERAVEAERKALDALEAEKKASGTS